MTDKKLDDIIHSLVDVRGYDREKTNDLLAFMNSLQNESVSEDLEEAINTIKPLTITEDYVSFETAKLLKEKGFDCSSYNHYRLKDGELCSYNTNCNTNFKHNDYMTAPTLQMAMKWLREVHKLEITPFHEMLQGNSWWYRIERKTSLSLLVEHEEDFIYGSYEQACEAAIKYCLENLI